MKPGRTYSSKRPLFPERGEEEEGDDEIEFPEMDKIKRRVSFVKESAAVSNHYSDEDVLQNNLISENTDTLNVNVENQAGSANAVVPNEANLVPSLSRKFSDDLLLEEVLKDSSNSILKKYMIGISEIGWTVGDFHSHPDETVTTAFNIFLGLDVSLGKTLCNIIRKFLQ